MSDIRKGRRWGGSTQREYKTISPVSLVQSLKVILKLKLQSSSNRDRDGEASPCSYTLLWLAQAFAPNFSASFHALILKDRKSVV